MPRKTKKWGSFIGQRKNIRRLEGCSEGSKQLGKACPSFLFRGGAGVGKTASLISAGRVACHRIGLRRGAIRISQTQLEAFLDETKQERREENAHVPLPKQNFKHLRA